MSREVTEGPVKQGADEAIRYRIACTPAPVSVVAVNVYDETVDYADVTATCMPAGSATINDGSIVLPLLQNLTIGHSYRVEVQYSDGISTIEPWIRVIGER